MTTVEYVPAPIQPHDNDDKPVKMVHTMKV